MVTHLVSAVSQGFSEIIIPAWSPKPQPALSSPVPVSPTSNRGKQFFLEFSCQNVPLGRVVIKVLEGAGSAGKEFEFLVTGRNGYGYKGSRVYACCKDEWCLLGDMLYQNPPPPSHITTDWDPRLPHGPGEHEDKDAGGGSKFRKLHRGCSRGTRALVDTKEPDRRGTVVAVATDYDFETQKWTLGPQIKLCLSNSLLKSGRVLGVLTEGMKVAQRLSRMGGSCYEPESRITISDCGALKPKSKFRDLTTP